MDKASVVSTIDELKKGVDVFISHASEDKQGIAKPLAEFLLDKGLTVFYDNFSIEWGESISRKIDIGLANCKLAVVILSPSYIKKVWTAREMDALQMLDEGKLLPIWHNISKKEVQDFSPTLVSLKAILSVDCTVEKIAKKIIAIVKTI